MANKPDPVIRAIRSEDEPFLREMLYEAIFLPEGSPPLPRDIVRSPEVARYVQDWGRPGDVGLLAVDRTTHQPLGAAWLRLFAGDDPGYGYVDDQTPELSIALLPGCRGKGIGTRLLSALFDLARRRYGAVSLSVSVENPALRLYRRLGFTAVREEGSSLTMIKALR